MDIEDFKLIGGPIAACVVTAAVIILCGMWAASAACTSQSRRMGFSHEWGPLEGCMIEYRPDRWIAMDKYRGADVQVNR